MAFMGIMVVGVVLVIILAVIITYLFIGFVLMLVGLICTLVDRGKEKKYVEWAAAQPVPVLPYKKKKAPRVVFYIGVGMWAVFALLVAFAMTTSAIQQHEYEENRNLYECLLYNDFDRAEELIGLGAVADSPGNTVADSTVPSEPGEDTMLFSFCNRDDLDEDENDLKKIEFLLDHGADIERRYYHHEKNDPKHRGDARYGFHLPDGCGRTPLMAAAGSGRVETVKLLIKHGADVNAIDYNGMTALMAAAKSMKGEFSADVIRILIQNGADIKVKDNFGQNVWDYADWADSDPVRKALREAGNWSAEDFR